MPLRRRLLNYALILLRLKDKYSPEHPDVIALEEKIASLNDELKQLQSQLGKRILSKPA